MYDDGPFSFYKSETQTLNYIKYKLHPRKRLQLISASYLSCFRFHLEHHFVIILLWWSGYNNGLLKTLFLYRSVYGKQFDRRIEVFQMPWAKKRESHDFDEMAKTEYWIHRIKDSLQRDAERISVIVCRLYYVIQVCAKNILYITQINVFYNVMVWQRCTSAWNTENYGNELTVARNH